MNNMNRLPETLFSFIVVGGVVGVTFCLGMGVYTLFSFFH
jgi:hypothetical protein